MPTTTKKIRAKTTKEQKQVIVKSLIKNPYAVIRELNNRSLYNFVKFFWSEYSTDPFSDNWHIEYICKELQKVAERVALRKIKKHDLIINIPPGTSKTSTIIIMFPDWCWTRWHWMRFISASYGADLSLESAEYARDIIRSEKFQAIYPEIAIKEDKDTKGNFRVVKKLYVEPGRAPRIQRGGNRLSTSVGAKIVGFHGDILLVDDPLNTQSSQSKTDLDKTNFWMDKSLPTRKTNKAVTVTILVMQRLHEDDPSGHLLDKEKKKIKHICLPGEIRNYRAQVSPKKLVKYYKDDLLDPNRLGWDILEELEADLGQYGFAGQVGQKPTPPGGGMFKVEMLGIVDQLPVPVSIEKTVRYWDKAGTAEWLKGKKGVTKNEGARTAGVKMCVLKNGKFIVTDVVKGRWESQDREAIILSTAQADGDKVDVWIEQEPGSGGKESAQATIRMLAGFHCEKENPVGDKAFRADPFSVQVNNGNVQLLRGDWNKDFKKELEGFPFGKLKDQVDASGAAFSKLTTMKRVKIYGRKK